MQAANRAKEVIVIVELPWTGERSVPQLQGDVAYEHLHRYAAAAELAGGRVVLDIACGEGYGSDLLARVAARVIGVDVDREAVEHASAAYRRQNLSFRVGTCSQMPVASGSIDLVVSFETLEHHDQHHEMLAEVKRVLRPDGMLVMSTPDKRFYSEIRKYSNPFHVRELHRADFEQLLSAHFEHHAVYGQRMCCGSVIAPLSDRDEMRFHSFRGNFRGLEREAGLSRATYLIGMAWDAADPPRLPSGLFEGDELLTDLELHARGKIFPDGSEPVCLDPDKEARENQIAALRRTVGAQRELLETLAAQVAELTPWPAEFQAKLLALQGSLAYWGMVRRVRRQVLDTLPATATVVVVSRGDDLLLDLDTRRAWHFPQNEHGVYAGHYPADGVEAIAQLEALRARGGDFLVIPSSGEWWLEDYPEFGRHVKANYRLVESRADTCMIFSLR